MECSMKAAKRCHCWSSFLLIFFLTRSENIHDFIKLLIGDAQADIHSSLPEKLICSTVATGINSVPASAFITRPAHL
ncbi:MAG: hypothetical protein D3922_06330 [Candidatus Electrothrix sp. AR1]|nr:hypothetical protein [Candidatus Electrothrix sp. AR1]